MRRAREMSSNSGSARRERAHVAQPDDKRTSVINGNDESQAKGTVAPRDDDSCNQDQATQNETYWRMRFERLQTDYDHLQNLNQKLEERLLSVVEESQRRQDELIANVEHEKSTLMADVDKLSTKLVDARIRLHDFEEKELLHAAGCDSPCHKVNNAKGGTKSAAKGAAKADRSNGLANHDQLTRTQMMNDPNLV